MVTPQAHLSSPQHGVSSSLCALEAEAPHLSILYKEGSVATQDLQLPGGRSQETTRKLGPLK
jgi:hypothetical protein